MEDLTQTPATTEAVAGVNFKCGEGGIRTLDTVAGIPVFETGPFSRSGTSPEGRESKGRVWIPTSHVHTKEIDRSVVPSGSACCERLTD